ncbi:MAG TPA: chemotaxis protein, partial [Pseudoalteromonas prydzensis]|nr:chemotaxis protein [Pseudoalteromonas prydzensis]
MLNNLSLRKKILLLIGGTITVLLIIASTFFVKHIANLSRENIENEAQSYLQTEQLSMQSYFAMYGKMVSTFVNNPHLINFFENWDTRDQALESAPGYN